MSTVLTSQTTSTGLEATWQIAARVGQHLRGGEVIELVGDLGAGKTAFVKGLARGAGSKDAVRSPSFTISNEYAAGELTLHHFDFYRLGDPGILKQEMLEVLADPKAVVIIEWAGIIEDVLPALRLTVQIKSTGENQRQITFKYPQQLKYLTS